MRVVREKVYSWCAWGFHLFSRSSFFFCRVDVFKMEQRTVIKFCVKLKTTATKPLKCWKVSTVKNVYREQVCLTDTKGTQKLRKWECKNRGWKQRWLHFFINHLFVPKKQTVNGTFHKEMIMRFIGRVHRVRTQLQVSGSWYLLHDNAQAHSSGVSSEFLAKWGIPVLSHLSYSLDLPPADFYPLN
jgi:hypothetical protein